MVLAMGSMYVFILALIHYGMSKRNLHSNIENDVFEVIQAQNLLIFSLSIFKKYIKMK